MDEFLMSSNGFANLRARPVVLRPLSGYAATSQGCGNVPPSGTSCERPRRHASKSARLWRSVGPGYARACAKSWAAGPPRRKPMQSRPERTLAAPPLRHAKRGSRHVAFTESVKRSRKRSRDSSIVASYLRRLSRRGGGVLRRPTASPQVRRRLRSAQASHLLSHGSGKE